MKRVERNVFTRLDSVIIIMFIVFVQALLAVHCFVPSFYSFSEIVMQDNGNLMFLIQTVQSNPNNIYISWHRDGHSLGWKRIGINSQKFNHTDCLNCLTTIPFFIAFILSCLSYERNSTLQIHHPFWSYIGLATAGSTSLNGEVEKVSDELTAFQKGNQNQQNIKSNERK